MGHSGTETDGSHQTASSCPRTFLFPTVTAASPLQSQAGTYSIYRSVSRYSQELMSFEHRLEKPPITSFGFFSLWSKEGL